MLKKWMSTMTEKIKVIARFTDEHRKKIIALFVIVSVLLLGFMTLMSIKSYSDSHDYLITGIEERMIALASAAREAIDPAHFLSVENAEQALASPEYAQDIGRLRLLANRLEVRYIYALKKVGDQYLFVYDSDLADQQVFTAYDDVNPVHMEAFRGVASACAYDMSDAYGSFSTGCVPIYDAQGSVIGVVAADIEDNLVKQHRDSQFANMLLLVLTILIMLTVLAIFLISFLSKLKTMSDALYRQSHYDKLTGLPNRQFLLERLDYMVKQNEQYALFFLDLDNFKRVNDTAGHDAGDALLVGVGEYLSSIHHGGQQTQVFRPAAGKLNVAARIGGDEFILVAPGMSPEKAQEYAEEIISGLRCKVDNPNISLFDIGFSIGIAFSPADTKDANVLIKYADIAMYHAKRSGKNTYLSYRTDMSGKNEK